MTSQPGHTGDRPAEIVVCYDGSPGATRALRSAATLFPGQPAIILYVRPVLDTARIRTAPVDGIRSELIEEVRTADQHDAEAVAERGAVIAARAGLKTRPLTVQAIHTTADTILQVARGESAAAVVIGRSGRTRLGSLMPGHVTPSVVDRCPIPVVVA